MQTVQHAALEGVKVLLALQGEKFNGMSSRGWRLPPTRTHLSSPITISRAHPKSLATQAKVLRVSLSSSSTEATQFRSRSRLMKRAIRGLGQSKPVTRVPLSALPPSETAIH